MLRVGFHSNSRQLADLAGKLNPQPSREGYATTSRQETSELYYPLLSDVFPGRWLQCFLAIIWANGTIPPHCDSETGDGKSKRFHLVIQSNANCWYMHNNQWQQLEEGGIYEFDPTLVHAAVNWGGEPRIHLVVDIAQ